MKKLVDGGADMILPPSKEELAEWKGVYLSYFDACKTVKQGRVLPKNLCVKNPRPDEIVKALESLGIKSFL